MSGIAGMHDISTNQSVDQNKLYTCRVDTITHVLLK